MSDLSPQDHLQIVPTAPDLTDQIERSTELIGRGGYGSVYKGKWLGVVSNSTPATIAIKIIDLVPLKDESRRKKRFKQIIRELSLWCSIQHENILPLLGIARINGDTNVPAFICPWMENGNAKEFCLSNPRFPPILILYDIINGLHYLHTSQPEIVHGDIKAVNVLINNRCEACLCDFGLSRFIIDNTLWKTTATHAGGTVRWMAPELLSGDISTPTKASDIYAYAMTCYEILSGDIPFRSVSNDMVIPMKVMRGQRPDRMKPFHSEFMWDIITRCWKHEPQDRLPSEKVSELLRSKMDWKGVEEELEKMGEKDIALVKLETEMAVLRGHMAVALEKVEQGAKALSTNEKALSKAKEDLKAMEEEKARAEEKMKALKKEKEIAETLLEKISAVVSAEEMRNAEKEEKIPRKFVQSNHVLAEMTTALTTLSNTEEVASKQEQLIRDLSDTNKRQCEEIRQMKKAGRTKKDNKQKNILLRPNMVYKGDESSVSKVAELVWILNRHIWQVSSLITDALFDQESPSINKEAETVWDELNDCIGPQLCYELKQRSKGLPDQFIALITLQTGLVDACSRIINDWNPPFWTEGLIFDRTYDRIKETKGQTTADAWRALTRSHITVVPSERQDANEKYLVEVLSKLIIAHGRTSDDGESIISQCKETVENIAWKAVGLHRLVSEEVTSVELVTHTIPCATQFDPSKMENAEEDNSSRSDIVVCTVDMGLRYRWRDKSGKMDGPEEEWDEVVLKPKVALTSTFES